ncbi:MAG TPA: LamG-like jellyroll fold domain-containing protein [Lacipirellulaceae bacterium]|nr:LamG-like jellyroll fold domain-containing protein [Lacipirellulaceae bacterium]
MNTSGRATRAACSLAAALLVFQASAQGAITGPYTADANTTYLFHFNEAAGATSAANSGTAGFAAIPYDGAAYAGDGVDQPVAPTVLGATGFSGFGNAADLSSSANVGLGVDVSGNGGFQFGDDAPLSNDALLDHSTIFGAGNQFTLEAMINVPAIATAGVLREIIATDWSSGDNAARGFQFRINAAGALEFNFIGVATSAVTAAIPTTGPHAFSPNQWFHVALAHDGTNARFYWTRVDPSFTTANLIGGPVAEAVDVSDDAILVIGNEGRNFGSGVNSTEGLRGLIDEVRISNIARSAGQMLFVDPAPGDVNGNNVVDIADFNIITANFLKTPATRAEGDVNSDNVVNFADFRIWKTNKTSPPGNVSIPEPAGAVLAVVASLAALTGRRRRTLLS